MASGLSGGLGRRGLKMPPSTTIWATWMPCGCSSPRHALRQSPQRELAHGERRRLRIALHARRSPGEHDRAVTFRHHALGGLLRHQEAAVSGHRERALDLDRIEIDERPAGAVTGIVDHHIGRADAASTSAKSFATWPRSVASQVKALPPTSCASAARFSSRRAATATFMPDLANRRASEALRPEPTPTMSAVR